MNQDRSHPPEFTVYQGHQKVASGKFEFGSGGTCSYSWRVPLTTAGKLKVVAYADLGGLGAKQGVPVGYDWVQPSLMPQVLPWLAILALLMLKPNRCASAWWILVPLACVGGVASLPEPVRQLLPSSQFEIFLELIGALGFGLAAVWLPDVGCWMLDVGFWMLDVGFWMLDFGCWMLDVGCWMLDVGFSAWPWLYPGWCAGGGIAG